MTSHLSTEQISKFLIGEATDEEREHARTCVDCVTELKRSQAVLAAFRNSVHHWADSQSRMHLRSRAFKWSKSPAFRIRPLQWALALAALIILAFPLFKNVSDRRREAEAFNDTLLLEQIEASLSRAVPAPMEPLLQLLFNVPESPAAGGHQ